MAVLNTAGHTALQSANRPIDYVNILHQSATRIISISYLKRNRFIFNYLNKSTVVSRRSLPAKNLVEPSGVVIGVRALYRHRVQEFRIIIWSSTVQ